MKTLSLIIVLGVVGLAVGYFLFGNQIPVADLIAPAKKGLAGAAQKLMGGIRNIEQVRMNILIAGGVGALAGLALSMAGGRRRK
jgi:hypothetical protein